MDMEDNKKRYLEKIIKWFVDDTVIDYNHRLWLPTFLEHMTDFPVPLRPLDISRLSLYPLTRLYNHCRDTYGLNNDEINYIWGNYSTIIIDKINNKESINESMDNKKRYLDKVVDFLVEDTKVDYEYRMIFFPFTYKRSLRQGSNNLTPFHRLLFDTYIPIDGFMEYIDESFGITSEEGIVYVWETYKVIMRDIVFGNSTSPLYFNESVDNKKRYLDKIVNYLVEDVEIDYEGKYIYFPFITPHVPPLFFPNDSIWLPSISSPYPDFIRFFSSYCIDTYGLTEDEIDYVWQKVRKILLGKIKNKKSINESVDKISKGEYMDKIIDYLVDDTMVDQKNKVWNPPFPTDHDKPTFNHFYGLIPMTDHLELKFLIGNSFVRNFFNYCKDTYGLTDDEEIRKLWKRYLKVLTPKINGFSIINGIPTINESVERLSEYLDKIVDFLIEDTIINYKRKSILTPFTPPDYHLFLFSPRFLDISSHNYSFFSIYCKNTYGLTDEEIEYIWKEYINIINNKISSYSSKSINESVDRKSDYLNKIVDFLIDDTEYRIYTNRFSDHSETKVDIWFPSDEEGYDYSKYDISDWSNDRTGWNLDDGQDIDYVCNTYSICDIDTVQELYNRYIQKLSTIIYEEMLLKNGDGINESVNRKDEYLDKIVEFLVTDTKVNQRDKVWYPPFYRLSSLSYDFFFQKYFRDYPASFSNYTKDIYGLSDDDIKYVWDRYKNIILDKFHNVSSLNESVNRKDEYLDKIVGFIVDDTEITIEKNDKSFKPLFTSVWFSPLYLKLKSESQLENNFLTYCKDTYGLTNSEIKVVFSKYRKTILNKFKGS